MTKVDNFSAATSSLGVPQPTLREVLRNSAPFPYLRERFHKFVLNEYCDENFDYWLRIQRLLHIIHRNCEKCDATGIPSYDPQIAKLFPQKPAELRDFILETYVREESEREINLEIGQRKSLIRSLQKCIVDDEASTEQAIDPNKEICNLIQPIHESILEVEAHLRDAFKRFLSDPVPEAERIAYEKSMKKRSRCTIQ